jgi:hypothetical protein
MTYGDLHKENINETFDPLWKGMEDAMPSQRIRMWNKHVKSCWEKETPEVQDKATKQAEDEYKTALADWKKKASFTGSPEDLSQ